MLQIEDESHTELRTLTLTYLCRMDGKRGKIVRCGNTLSKCSWILQSHLLIRADWFGTPCVQLHIVRVLPRG